MVQDGVCHPQVTASFKPVLNNTRFSAYLSLNSRCTAMLQVDAGASRITPSLPPPSLSPSL
eukprot:1119962-Pyramimonas_sp.AAC.1